MIKANHKFFWVQLSLAYSNYFLKRHFRNLRYIGEYEQTDLPVLIIANHFSWWDGFIQILINKYYFKRKFHFMMLERELRKSMELSKAGAYSVNKGNRSSFESIRYTSELLEDKNNIVLFFPQGKIQSIYTEYFKFEKGMLSNLLENQKNEFQLVFNVNLIDYAAHKKAELSCYFKTYNLNNSKLIEDIEESFNEYAKECKLKNK